MKFTFVLRKRDYFSYCALAYSLYISMDPKHRHLLTSNCQRLADMIDLNEQVLCLLILRKVFTLPMLEDILSKESQKAKTEELILELRTRGPSAFQKFLDILVATRQVEPAAVLEGKATYPKPIQGYRKHAAAANEGPMQLEVRAAKEVKVGPEFFKMTSKPRGKCLIINNIDFRDVMKYRFGSEKDGMKLDIIFNQLGYDVKLKCDQETEEIEKLVQKFAKDPEHKYLDSCVVIILSHGHSGLIYGVDCKELYIEYILQQFNNENCPGLRGKPKMFFIQACRGANYDSGVAKIQSTDAGVIIPPSRSTTRMPTYSDMLIAYSTVDGYVSVREHTFGTWFCQELVDALIENACDTDLETILKRVDKRVQERVSWEGEKQSTEWTGRGWNKTLYFNPGFYDPMK